MATRYKRHGLKMPRRKKPQKLGQTPYFPLNTETDAFECVANTGKYAGIRLEREWLAMLWAVPRGAKGAQLRFFAQATSGSIPFRPERGNPYYCWVDYPDSGWEETYADEYLGPYLQTMFSQATEEKRIVHVECHWSLS